MPTKAKTTPTSADVATFLSKLDDARRRDAERLVEIMGRATKAPPKMWGKSIVGFGRYRYRYETGREGETMVIGFAPRAKDFTLYLGPAAPADSMLSRLGKHRAGKACLYVNRLDDVDVPLLEQIIAEAVRSVPGERLAD